MECLSQTFPVIIDFLLIILLVVLIFILIRFAFTLQKIDKLIDDVQIKINSLQNVFDIIDHTTDYFSLMSDKIIGFVMNGISKLFKRKEDEKSE